MTIELEPVARHELSTEGVKVRRRKFDGILALFAGTVSVHVARQGIVGRELAQVGVDDEVEFFELLEYSIDRCRTDFGAQLLNSQRFFVRGEVSRRAGEDVRDGAFGDRDARGATANG